MIYQKHDIRREKQKRSLEFFIKQYWHVLEPATPLIWGRVMSVMAEHLEAVARNDITKLIINVPMGFSKSLMVGVFFPSWLWITRPHERFLTASHSATLAMRDARKQRNIILSKKYQSDYGELSDWDNPVVIDPSQASKSRFENTLTGFRYATSVGSGATGERGSIRILDDPTDSKQIHSEAYREAAHTWIKEVWASRYSDASKPTEILVQQRQHTQDIVGVYDELGGYEKLILPMEYQHPRYFTSLGDYDWRQKDGELLFPERFDVVAINTLKKALGKYGAAAQMQQIPVPIGGGIFQAKDLKFWHPYGADLGKVKIQLPDRTWLETTSDPLPPVEIIEQSFSGDLSFGSKTDTASLVSLQVWGRVLPYGEDPDLDEIRQLYKANYYLLDRVGERMSFTETLATINKMLGEYPNLRRKLIEAKANGAAVMDSLRGKVGGIIAIEPEGGKLVRAHAISWLIDGGNVYLPHPALYNWVSDLVGLMTQFPNGATDDDVDAMTQYLNYVANGSKTTLS